jgi:hypothetical protein
VVAGVADDVRDRPDEVDRLGMRIGHSRPALMRMPTWQARAAQTGAYEVDATRGRRVRPAHVPWRVPSAGPRPDHREPSMSAGHGTMHWPLGFRHDPPLYTRCQRFGTATTAATAGPRPLAVPH